MFCNFHFLAYYLVFTFESFDFYFFILLPEFVQKSPGKSEIYLQNVDIEYNLQLTCQAKNGAQDDEGEEILSEKSGKLIVRGRQQTFSLRITLCKISAILKNVVTKLSRSISKVKIQSFLNIHSVIQPVSQSACQPVSQSASQPVSQSAS